jgi:hypothetical protein
VEEHGLEFETGFSQTFLTKSFPLIPFIHALKGVAISELNSPAPKGERRVKNKKAEKSYLCYLLHSVLCVNLCVLCGKEF